MIDWLDSTVRLNKPQPNTMEELPPGGACSRVEERDTTCRHHDAAMGAGEQARGRQDTKTECQARLRLPAVELTVTLTVTKT